MVNEDRRDLEISLKTASYVKEEDTLMPMRPADRKWFLRGVRLKAIFAAVVLLAGYGGAFALDPEKRRDVQIGVETSRQLVKQAEKLIKRGRFNEAEPLLRRAADLDRESSSIKLRLAYVFLKQRRLADSYRISFDVAEAEPKNSAAFALLGATFLAAGKFPQARQMYIQSITLNKKQAFAWAGLGQLEFYENRIQESLLNLKEAVYRDPNEPDYIFALAQVSARAEKYKEAAEAYQKFLAISRDADDERRDRIRGLISFLKFLGSKNDLYENKGESTVVPIEIVSNRPVIELKINGREKPLRFVLDTGSGISVISAETAQELKIDEVARGGFARGLGGDGRFPIVYGFLRRIEIGSVEVKNVPVYIREFHSTGKQIDGYIGLSLISKFLMTLDYGQKTFGLKKQNPTETVLLRQTVENDPSIMAMPLRLTSSGFLSGEVKLHGLELPLNFIVDTGASVSVISDELAGLKEMVPHSTNEKLRVIGSAGITDEVPSFRLPEVTIGDHSQRNITAIALDLDLINEASGFEQSGILGGNFLMKYSMTFDFRNSIVTFKPISTPVK